MASREISDLRVVSVGEVLWDLVGGEQHLGGAPFNFAYHAHAAGARASVITRVGQDDLGAMIVKQANALGLPPAHIQRDAVHPTGTVPATLDSSGVATYVITEDVAWDYIQFTDGARETIDSADILCFGTLAQRCPISRASILASLAATKSDTLRVLDINLRHPHYDRAIIASSLRIANLLKLNEEELIILQTMFELQGDETQVVHQLMSDYDLRVVVVTRGGNGAAAWAGDSYAALPGLGVKVVDTIGSGDAFTAHFVLQFQSHGNLEGALRRANAAGAYVATQKGATPAMSPGVLEAFAASLGVALDES